MTTLDALTIHGDDDSDWYNVADDAYRQPQWACIEGTAVDMIAMANAIENAQPFRSENRRCAVYPRDDGGFEISSPRNSMSPTMLSASQAKTLARNIRAVLETRAKKAEKKR